MGLFSKSDDEDIIKEFLEHGELSNNIKLLHYGSMLLEEMHRHKCTLSELLNAINKAAQKQIGDHNLGRAIL